MKTSKQVLWLWLLGFGVASAGTVSLNIDGIEDLGPILKLFIERWVCGPQRESFETLTSPIVSFSILNSISNIIIQI